MQSHLRHHRLIALAVESNLGSLTRQLCTNSFYFLQLLFYQQLPISIAGSRNHQHIYLLSIKILSPFLKIKKRRNPAQAGGPPLRGLGKGMGHAHPLGKQPRAQELRARPKETSSSQVRSIQCKRTFRLAR